MYLDILGLIGACSYALDCVEAELVHSTNKHSKRVAYMSVCIAMNMGINDESLQDLAACALMHDNALTQYIKEELHNNYIDIHGKQKQLPQVGQHCILGEQNIKSFHLILMLPMLFFITMKMQMEVEYLVKME